MLGTYGCQPQCPLRVRRITASTGLEGSEDKMNSPLRTFLHLFLYSPPVPKSFQFIEICKTKAFSELGVSSLYLWRSQMWSKWKTPFLTTSPAKWEIFAGRQLLIYLREQNGDMTVGTKVSGYLTKFCHWRSHGVEEAIQQAKEEGSLLNVHSPCGTNRSSYEAYHSIYSIYQSYKVKWKIVYLITPRYMCL